MNASSAASAAVGINEVEVLKSQQKPIMCVLHFFTKSTFSWTLKLLIPFGLKCMQYCSRGLWPEICVTFLFAVILVIVVFI